MKTQITIIHKVHIVLAVVLLVNICGKIHASIVANFTDGTGTTLVDQYAGLAGAGWLTAWTLNTSGGTASATVNSLSPLSGGGNYLSYSHSYTSTSVIAYAGVYRQHDTAVVDLTQPLVYTIDYRVDYAAATDFQYVILSSTVAANATSSNDTWYIKSTLTNGWQVGGTNTGISVVVGDVYRFTITVNPSSKNYIATVADLTAGTSYTTTTIAFRNTTAASDGSYLCFGIRDDAYNASDTFGFSIDNISITSIPEPSTIAYLVVGVFGLLISFKSSRKFAFSK